MNRYGPVVVGVVVSIVLSFGLSQFLGQSLFPGINRLVGGPQTFAGIDRDPGAPTPAPFEPPEDEGSPTRAEVLRMLRSRDFATLTQTLEAKRARVAQDVRHEAEWNRVIATFGINDPSITPLIEDWVAASPDSIVPYVASGTHMYALAFDARGTKSARDTSRAQFAGMEKFLEKVNNDAGAALLRDPKEVLGYRLLIDVARAAGTQAECGTIARDGLTAVPASLRIRWALAICRLPRWGGSRAGVEAVWEKARPFVVENPELSVLGGVMAYDEGRMLDDDAAMRLLDQALAAGPYPAYFLARAREHFDRDRFEATLEDANLGLIISPQDPELLAYQFRALADLGQIDKASAALDVLAEVDPTNPDLAPWRDWVTRTQATTGAGSAWEAYKRGRELLKAGDDGGALAAFQLAVQRDPAHFDSYQNIDYLLVKRREFDTVIRYWGAYLSRRPDDGRGYLERAGTNRHKGDLAAAQADIMKACELKNDQACGIAKSQGWQ